MTLVNEDELGQTKFLYYQKTIFFVVLISCISELAYLASDFELFRQAGAIADFKKCILPRSICVLFTIFYAIVNHKCKNYKILIPLAFITLNSIMWSTIGAIQFLPTTSYAREGFIIMHFMFLIVGVCSPKKYIFIFEPWIIINILISHFFLRPYPDLNMMITLGSPLVFAVITTVIILDKTFRDQFIAKKELELLGVTDNLTGAFNRHRLDNFLVVNNNEKRFNIPIGLILLDIDFFKKINDTFGHEEGDEVLKFLANLIKELLEKDECLIRFGGEEFLILVPYPRRSRVETLLVEIQKHLKSTQNIHKITVSMGAYIADRNERYLKAIEAVDSKLYNVKEHGRNNFLF